MALSLVTLFAGCGTGSATDEIQRATGTGDGDGDQKECAFTQGYWKNHPEAWPTDELTLGTVEYDQDQLLAILGTPVQGNGLVALAHQLIAAKLNILNGADGADIADEIAAADALIGGGTLPPYGDAYAHPSVTSSLVDALDEFNNTGECKPAPVCGNGVVEDGEECDDGNDDNYDSCRNDCTCPPPAPVCGNGVVEDGEECDDGNDNDTDSCSNACKICIIL